MGNFLLTIASKDSTTRAARLFRRGLDRAQQLKSQAPRQILESEGVRLATFARHNGSGGNMARDETTGNWLVACGTWFHADGDASGDEARLLARIAANGAARVARELEGFFVIAFGGARTREVTLITDLMGSRHCFRRECGDCLAISTSSLLLASLREASLDQIGCQEFLRAGVIYEDRTLFRDVKKLGPATITRFRDGRPIESHRYWHLSDLDPDAFDGRQAVERLSGTLVDSVKRICRVYRRPICDLTGGYDSRLVVAGFLRAGVPFETTVAGPWDSPDVLVSQRLSLITRAPHWHVEPRSHVTFDQLQDALGLTDGEYDLIEYARIHAIHRMLSEKFDISINGSYGESARGYWWGMLRPRTGARMAVDPRRLAAKRYGAGASSPQLFPSDDDFDIVEHLAEVIARANRELAGWPNTAQMDNAYLMLRMHRWQGRIASSTDQHWPCLSPFLFRSVLDTALQATVRSRKNSRLTRGAMVALHPQLAAEPLETGYPPMPLTLATWPIFLPAAHNAIGHFAGKIWNKVRRKVFGASSPQGAESPRLRLWRDPQARDVLAPETMKLNALIETSRLQAFLDASRQHRFAFDAEWQRVLSLEMALRSLGSMK